ncbi:hypothetical protein VC83_02010 [Pseudogymnoascus destructans]|uniref:Cation-transporting P-type ATPase N-terminal domain-containing protein n=2 Tax=Pseudogymnoascus destructans TaxID=655981 RepID=L8FUF3_PSED2|nr:uncharacterized protein VC83_02010 [Pseudogymnoascus destructans]ELR04093.1 hypothetical protein GMDG_01397 [Pseudogymnoascus destructans 20631-21]OAF61599.1 hypothetical protein VC83_02010 [Pseudogymnoascus destructans]
MTCPEYYAPRDNDANQDLESDEKQARIRFHDLSDNEAPQNGRAGRTQRRMSRDSSRRRSMSAANTGIPLEFRTLSIGLSESKQISREFDGKEEKPRTEELDYFANLDFHSVAAEQVLKSLDTSEKLGLDATAAAASLERDGSNTLPKVRDQHWRKIFWYIFGGFCSILWFGVIVFFLCWQPLSSPPSIPNLALAILVIIVIFLQASFSAFQDWSTKRVMNSILDLLPAEAMVIRDGQAKKMPTTELVVGDIVQISIGNKVPADLRLLSTSGDIRFDRSVLTGEPDEIEGAINCTNESFLESRNIALMGTLVTNGNGTGVVVLTGGKSVMGRIAKATTAIEAKPTLIQQEISRFIKIIVFLTVCLALLILLSWAGWVRIKHPGYMSVVAMLNNVMGCIVAFIPEGMPIGVALTLMMVANRMKAANILPKGLATVETLGCVNVLCSDKTGTLTENKMVVSSTSFVDKQYSVEDTLDMMARPGAPETFSEFHKAALLCNDSVFDPVSMDLPVGQRQIHGNATDAAVFRFAETAKSGDVLRNSNPRAFQIPFNSKNKWMLTMHSSNNGDQNTDVNPPEYVVYIKGAPDVLLPNCSTYFSAETNKIQPLDEKSKELFSALQDRLARKAERVIILCRRLYTPHEVLGSNYFGDEIVRECIQDLTIIGVFGIMDPPRAETANTVECCRRAGIRFFMVTGDFGTTAVAVARQVGIITGDTEPHLYEDIVKARDSKISRDLVKMDDQPEKRFWRRKTHVGNLPLNAFQGSLVLDGTGLGKLTAEDWDIVCSYREIVFARTTPEQKLRIVNEFKDRENVVAVTGDGVNDAPALRAAHVGVAVVSGSDVAIEAADLVLLDKFDSIVDAIRLGRVVFQNLQKMISYLLPAGSWSEIWPVLLNVFVGVPLPLSSFLMIIICVFTDVFSSMALIMEQEEFDLLSLPPRNHKRDHLINFKIYAQSYLFIGVMETVMAHAMFFLYMYQAAGIPMRSLLMLFEGYTEGFYGYTEAELTHFNNVGQCVYFVTLVILQWGNLLSIRNKRLSITQADPIRKAHRNVWIPCGALTALCIAIFVTETPAIQNVFGTGSVPIKHWLIPLGLATALIMMDEIRKLFVRLFPKGPIARVAW